MELIQVYLSGQSFSSCDAFQRQDVRRLLQQGVILGASIPYFPLLHSFSYHFYCVDSNSILLPRSSKRLSTLSSRRSRPIALGWLIGILLLEFSDLRSSLIDGGFFFGRRHSFPFSLLLKVPSLSREQTLECLTVVNRPSSVSSTNVLLFNRHSLLYNPNCYSLFSYLHCRLSIFSSSLSFSFSRFIHQELVHKGVV